MKRTLLITLLLASVSQAQWSTNPANNLIVGYGEGPQLASDGAGGCYITYIQQVSIYDRVWLERLNRYGYKPWARRQIVGDLPGQTSAKITEDGLGGVIVGYSDVLLISPHEPPILRLRVQRVDSSGNFLWGPTGVRVSLSETNQGNQAIVPDGVGGCIVAWVDTLGDLRINRINATGNRIWGDSGKYVWNSPETPPMISDLRSGCYILYGIGRLQHFRPDGSAHWPPQGVLIPTGPWIMRLDQTYVYLFGSRVIGYNGQLIFTIHLQKVDSSGNLLWDSLGVTLDTLNTNLFLNYDFSSQFGYSTIAWPQSTGGIWDLRTQIVRSNGTTVFPFGGIPVSRVASSKGLVGVVLSDSMRNVFVWGDSRTPGGMYAQRLDTLGQPLWDSNDVAVNFPQFGEMKVITDGNGGYIGVGFHQFDFSIRALLVNKYGQLGQVITAFHENSRDEIPHRAILYQNYPNPFNPQTTIRFQLPRAAPISLTLYNILGQNIKTLASGVRQAGMHSVILEANGLPSGTYIYRLTTPEAVLTHKLLIIK